MLHRMSNGLGIFVAAKNNRAIHVSEMPDLTGNSTKIAFSHNHTRNRWHPTSDQRLVARGARGRASQGDRAASVLSHRLDGNGSRGKLWRHNEVAKAMDYMLRLIDVFTRFLDDGRICLGNNSAERELRGVALARKSWLFAGSDRGSAHAALMLTLIRTAKLNEVDPQGVLAWIADHKITDLTALLHWNWRHAIPVVGTA